MRRKPVSVTQEFQLRVKGELVTHVLTINTFDTVTQAEEWVGTRRDCEDGRFGINVPDTFPDGTIICTLCDGRTFLGNEPASASRCGLCDGKGVILVDDRPSDLGNGRR